MKTAYKCRYSYCKNDNIVPKEKAVKEKNAYYCEECLKEKQIKGEIREYYMTYVDEKCNKSQLNQVIKRLINDMDYDSELVLYMVKWIYDNNCKINNCLGLTYYIKNDKMLLGYKNKVLKVKSLKIKSSIENDNLSPLDVTMKKLKRSSRKPKWIQIVDMEE